MTEYKESYRAGGKRPSRYPREIKGQAVEMFGNCRKDYGTNVEAARHVAGLLGIGSFDTVLNWVRQAEIDGGEKPGLTTDAQEELRRLRRENAELKRANGILKAASAFFAAELDQPQNK